MPRCHKDITQYPTFTNINFRRLKCYRIFKWAVGEELVASSVYHGLQAVQGLRRGRSGARETRPVRPVSDADIEAVLPFVAPAVAAMVRIQRLTGMRSGELVLMRACDIDTSGEVWLYTPAEHKNSWRNLPKVIPLGPKAQAILGPLIKPDPMVYLFSPKDAANWHQTQRSAQAGANRQTKTYPCERLRLARQKVERRSRPKRRSARDRYQPVEKRPT